MVTFTFQAKPLEAVPGLAPPLPLGETMLL